MAVPPHPHPPRGGGAAVSPPSLPPPRPKSRGKFFRREAARVQMLEREIGFLEAELKFIDGTQPASKYCKEISDFIIANPDPLIPAQRKNRRSCRFWKWLCSGIPCLNVLSFCCCCQSECSCHLRRPTCCDSDCCRPDCGGCKNSCCSCSSCSGSSCCQRGPSCCRCGSCSRGIRCSCPCSCSDMIMPCCFCIPRRCCCSCRAWPSCPKSSSCCRCKCRWSSCFRCPKLQLCSCSCSSCCCCNCKNLCSNPCCLAL